ncbi:YdeI/OmpD-associated family protein [Naasia aerilata]|uniref:Bacteriocin-protection protein n=1 Tax=Naasia aerilata TaxID=1162966 RepID=A0ABM8GED7_9MICO|nr:YdeI/OmpD-associated family protein [Naasia aerilata]BDZ46658.1 hypothetical protein GCM10025866_25670 [Naasia aerilata]
MSKQDDAPRVHAETAEEWRAWLLEHGETEDCAWLVSWRRETGRPSVGYEESVVHALSVGWVDSTQKKLDDDRLMLYFARRKSGSVWSRPNKVRVERILREGLMTPAGARVIEEAKRTGSWNALDEVEDRIVPDDLAAALAAASPEAAGNWAAYSSSARGRMLTWISQAKRPETRERRVAETARFAAAGERFVDWPPPRTAAPPA